MLLLDKFIEMASRSIEEYQDYTEKKVSVDNEHQINSDRNNLPAFIVLWKNSIPCFCEHQEMSRILQSNR